MHDAKIEVNWWNCGVREVAHSQQGTLKAMTR
jgi:hypothetical protein